MPLPTYYKPVQLRRKYGAIFDHSGREVREAERGLTDLCPANTGKDGHEYLLLPYEMGMKEYLICINCLQPNHL